ncbi:hypothetical protein KCU73_g11675, partial [Aureobasidium melanogenum]
MMVNLMSIRASASLCGRCSKFTNNVSIASLTVSRRYNSSGQSVTISSFKGSRGDYVAGSVPKKAASTLTVGHKRTSYVKTDRRVSCIHADGNLVGSKQGELKIHGKVYPSDSWTNVPSTILENVSRKLHQQENHPISITRKLIESRFPGYQHHNEFDPVVTVGQNFDSLGFPLDHPGRSRTDTYYINKDTVLRTHTSAHQADVFRA